MNNFEKNVNVSIFTLFEITILIIYFLYLKDCLINSSMIIANSLSGFEGENRSLFIIYFIIINKI